MDGLSDISMNVDGSGEHDKNESFSAAVPDHSNSQPVLLTPDAFTTSSPRYYFTGSLCSFVISEFF